MTRRQAPIKKGCKNCKFTGKCPLEYYFKTEKIHTCPDYREKEKTFGMGGS